MTSRLNQRATSILAVLSIAVLIALIVLLWILVGHGTFSSAPVQSTPAATVTTVPSPDEPPGGRRGLVSHKGGTPGVEDDAGGSADVELVVPVKVSPPPLHEHDIIYEQIYNNKDTQELPTIRHHSGHFRHKLAEVWDPHPEYEVTVFGRKLHLVLAHDNSFLRPTLEVVHVWTNFTRRVRPELRMSGCYYTGRVQDEPHSLVAVSLCGGMTGYIHSDQGNYYIEPTESIHDGTSGVQQSSVLHRITKISSSAGEHRTPGPVEEPCDTDDDVVGPGVHHVTRRDVSWMKHGNLGASYRPGHPGNREYVIETLVVADKKMAEYHRTDENLMHYILTLMSHVAILYKDATIGNPISMAVVRVLILKDKEFVKQRDGVVGVSSAEMLKHFCQYQHSIRFETGSLAHHDTALLLTRETICRNTAKHQCDTLGLAELGTMCNPYSSCAIIKDKGLSTSYTIAHELGHVLNMPHDDDHRCQRFHASGELKHIMSKMMQNDTKPWMWSSCSRHHLTEFLESSRSICLLDSPKSDIMSNMSSTAAARLLPGEQFDEDRQCELVYGNGSKICSFMPPCGALWCATEHGEKEGCKTQFLPWADGTRCGPDHWCHRGECVAQDRHRLRPVAGGWSEWHAWGECSRTCGGGIQRGERFCDHPLPANGGPYCIGSSVQYRSCNTEPCESRVDFRVHQCAQYNDNTLGIHNLTADVRWLPKYGGILPDDVCKLYCRVHGHNAYYLLNDKVVDGTKCGVHSFDICVNGVCRKGGCDNRLNSNLTLNECGICGGNNAQCEEISGTYNVTKPTYGYNKVIRIPKGSSGIDIRQHGYQGSSKDGTYLALVDSRTGKYLLNGDFTVSTFGKVLPYDGVSIEYSGSKAAVERVNSSKNIQLTQDLIVEFLSVDRLLPPDITYSYKVTKGSAPVYSWQLYDDDWSACSSICAGVKHLIPHCVHVASGRVVTNEWCADQPRHGAHSQQECNTHCRLAWKLKHRARQCSVHCGPGVRQLQHQCVKIELSVASKATTTTTSSNNNHLYSLLESNAAAASTELDDVPWAVPVDEEHCANIPKPVDHEPCDGPCDITRWEYEQWSVCTKTCGGGVQTRKARCMDASGNQLETSACQAHERLSERTCNVQKCPIWSLGDWTPCSVTCGKGYRIKPIYCHLDGEIIAKEFCDAKSEPVAKESCQERPCVRWRTGDWSHCSVTCTTGTAGIRAVESRQVLCETFDGDILESVHCQDMLSPNTTRPCRHIAECPPPPVPVTAPAPAVNNPVDMDEILDNSIIPIHTFDSYMFTWRSGPWSECSRTCNTGTMSRNVACQNVSGAQREGMCDPAQKPRAQILCNTQPCPTWNHGHWSNCEPNCRKYRLVMCQDASGTVSDSQCSLAERPANMTECTEHRRCSTALIPPYTSHHHHHHHHQHHQQQPQQQSPVPAVHSSPAPPPPPLNARWRVGGWSACSQSCGRGVKVRQVSCTDPAHNVTLVEQYCVRQPRPRSQRPCSRAACTYAWHEGPWTQCTVSCGEGLMYRNVTCRRGDTGLPDAGCDPGSKPPSFQKCLVSYCNEPQYTWATGSWRDCTHPCEFRGRQVRRLYCRNRHGKDVQKKLCSKLTKPKRKRNCNHSQCAFHSCEQVRQRLKSARSREHELMVRGRRVRVYCHMSAEYITLPNDGLENYAEMYDRRLVNPDTCPHDGQRNDTHCACLTLDAHSQGLTVYARVRLNITTLQLVSDDYTFSRQVKGARRVPYGTAGDCYSRRAECPQGRFSIDLTGTGFRLASSVSWQTTGSGASQHVNKQEMKVSGKCGGYCGSCQPDNSVGLQLEIV